MEIAPRHMEQRLARPRFVNSFLIVAARLNKSFDARGNQLLFHHLACEPIACPQPGCRRANSVVERLLEFNDLEMKR